MNIKTKLCAFVAILVGSSAAGCGSTSPILTPTLSRIFTPTSRPTLTPTISPTPECGLFDSDFAYLYSPRPADRAGWCEVEYSDFTIPYPAEWVLDAGGVWGQNLSFHVNTALSSPPDIGVIGGSTDLPVEQADRIVLEMQDGEKTFHDPLVHPEEIVLDRTIKTIGDTQILVLTTNLGDRAIKRFFWLNKLPFLLNKRMLLVFEVRGSFVDFEGEEYRALIGTLEEMIAAVRVTPTCADGFTRLHGGMDALVTVGGAPSQVRSGSSINAELIAQIDPGSIVAIGTGPVCADGLVFWYVYNPGIPGGGGWAAEGDFAGYYLEPYYP